MIRDCIACTLIIIGFLVATADVATVEFWPQLLVSGIGCTIAAAGVCLIRRAS